MVFYICPKCQKKWQHPVGICPFCFSDLERIKTSQTKVVASSKVLIPNLLHPKIPYYALVVEDEKGMKYAYKSVQERKIGEEIIFKTAESDGAVAIWKAGYDLLDAVENIVALLSNLKLNEKSKVVILPTLISPVHNYFRDNTSTEFLSAILEYLKSIKVKNIKVASQSLDDAPILGLAQKSGLSAVLAKSKIDLLDLAKTDFEERGKVKISKEVINADLVINLSALKSGKGVSTDNLFRSIEKDNYLALKYLYGEDFIAKEVGKLDNVLTIGEAIHPQRSDKFSVFRSLVFASKNSANLDAVFNVTGMVSSLPKYLKEIDVSKIEIVGRSILEVERNINVVL
jgi:hypothetical protein